MKKRDKSIIQEDMSKCYICGSNNNLHTHEVFYGSANRQHSIDWGCYVRLCAYHHNMSNDSVHFNKEMDIELKQICQKRFEEIYNHEKFMSVFHKNYL